MRAARIAEIEGLIHNRLHRAAPNVRKNRLFEILDQHRFFRKRSIDDVWY